MLIQNIVVCLTISMENWPAKISRKVVCLTSAEDVISVSVKFMYLTVTD